MAKCTYYVPKVDKHGEFMFDSLRVFVKTKEIGLALIEYVNSKYPIGTFLEEDSGLVTVMLTTNNDIVLRRCYIDSYNFLKEVFKNKGDDLNVQ